MKVYGYPKCNTTNQAIKWLKEKGYEIDFINNKSHHFTIDEVKQLFELSHQPINKMFNTSGQVYRELNLKAKLPSMTEDQKLALLACDGMLLKRPIIHNKEIVLIGFKLPEWEQSLK